ncbi:antirestriction protein [Enterobacter hormaechei]|uniref:antirestriction protein n=1 Tax=Enterobacter hormaechei TaxID=158836 RepID=UPI003F525D7D
MNQTVICCDAVRLEGAQRLTFLPDMFGGDYMTAEASVYAYAQRYCPDYQGGFWQFYRLPDGSGFMAPDVESVTFCNPDSRSGSTAKRAACPVHTVPAWCLKIARTQKHVSRM